MVRDRVSVNPNPNHNPNPKTAFFEYKTDPDPGPGPEPDPDRVPAFYWYPASTVQTVQKLEQFRCLHESV